MNPSPARAETARALDPSRGLPPIEVSTVIEPAEWDAYVSAHPEATADHLWGWRAIVRGVFGHETVHLIARRGADIVGVLPLVLVRSRLFGRSVCSVPFLNYGGVLSDDRAAAAVLVEEATAIAKAFGASHLELRHQRRRFDHLPCRQHKLGLSRRLPADVGALWAQTDRKVRNQVRKAQKAGLVTETGGGDLVSSFYLVFSENMRDLGTPVYAAQLFHETLRVFADRVSVFIVRHGRVPVAGAIAIRLNDTVLVPWASSRRRYRSLCPNMLLYWAMLERATAEGVQIFDFGRSSPGTGAHQFKRQWGAEEAPLAWEYVLLSTPAPPDQGPSNPSFRVAVEAWKRLPLGVSNRLGPWIARHLP